MQNDSRKFSESSSSGSDLNFEDLFLNKPHYGGKSTSKTRKSEQTNLEIENSQNSQKYARDSSSSSETDNEDEIIYVPDNPKKWSENDITAWIQWATKKFKLAGSIDSEKFPQKAEELANFTKAEFYIACGSFEGGEKVLKHYKYLMERADEPCNETLLKDGEPGQCIKI